MAVLLIGLENTSAPQTPHHHITNSLYADVPFTQYVMPGIQPKITRHTKSQKHSLKRQNKRQNPTQLWQDVEMTRWGI